jgi:hypothetical protein
MLKLLYFAPLHQQQEEVPAQIDVEAAVFCPLASTAGSEEVCAEDPGSTGPVERQSEVISSGIWCQ